MKKFITFSSSLLALICLLTSFCALFSCADKDKENKPAVTDSKPLLTHLEGLDFGGSTVNFLVASADNDSYHRRSVCVSEDLDDLGDTVNSALYNRNALIENNLNVKIEIASEGPNKLVSWAKTALLSGTDEYDVIAGLQYGDVQLALDGVLVDLSTLAQKNADYIKYNEEYWASGYIEALSFGDKVYWLTGDLCMRFTGGYYCYFVNSRIYDNKLASKYGSIYDLVTDKKWNLDLLAEMVPLAYSDVNGNEAVDIEDDVLGLALPVHDNTNGMAVSAGVRFTTYDENRVPSNNIRTSNETLISYMESLYKLCNLNGEYSFGGNYPQAMGVFASGKAAFISGRLNQAELYLGAMEDDFYVIPCPMLNSAQTEYYSSVHDAVNIYGININSSNIPATAAVLESMAYESYYTIRPIYYDSFLKFKYTRDSKAAAMIDIMHDTVYTDFVYIWQFSADLNTLGSFLRLNAANNKASSELKTNQTKWDTGLADILTRIENLDKE